MCGISFTPLFGAQLDPSRMVLLLCRLHSWSFWNFVLMGIPEVFQVPGGTDISRLESPPSFSLLFVR